MKKITFLEEKQKFVKNLFQYLDLYEQRFGNLKHNLRRSGLERNVSYLNIYSNKELRNTNKN